MGMPVYPFNENILKNELRFKLQKIASPESYYKKENGSSYLNFPLLTDTDKNPFIHSDTNKSATANDLIDEFRWTAREYTFDDELMFISNPSISQILDCYHPNLIRRKNTILCQEHLLTQEEYNKFKDAFIKGWLCGKAQFKYQLIYTFEALRPEKKLEYLSRFIDELGEGLYFDSFLCEALVADIGEIQAYIILATELYREIAYSIDKIEKKQSPKIDDALNNVAEKQNKSSSQNNAPQKIQLQISADDVLTVWETLLEIERVRVKTGKEKIFKTPANTKKLLQAVFTESKEENAPVSIISAGTFPAKMEEAITGCFYLIYLMNYKKPSAETFISVIKYVFPNILSNVSPKTLNKKFPDYFDKYLAVLNEINPIKGTVIKNIFSRHKKQD